MLRFFVPAFFCVLASASITSARPAAVDSPCSTQGDVSTALLSSYKWLATATDTSNVASRQTMGLPAIAASEVSLVADTAVCRTAVNAFNNALLPEAASTLSVHVIRFGPTRYAVFDENRMAGEWIYRVIFNTAFTQVVNIGRD